MDGGGDIKLAALMGLLLGLQKTALAMFLAFDTAAIVGNRADLAHRKKRSDMIPFGPFLMAATLVVYFGKPDYPLVYSRLHILACTGITLMV